MDELHDIVLPFAAKVYTPYSFLVSRCKALSWRNARNETNFARTMEKECLNLAREIAEKNSEVSTRLSFNPSSFQAKKSISTSLGSYLLDLNVSSEELTRLKLSEIINVRPTLAAEYIIAYNEGKFLKDELMPAFQDKFRDELLAMNTGLVSSFAIGQKQYQDIVRNYLGKKFYEQAGLNPFLPKETVVQELNKAKELLSREVELQFLRNGNIVAAYTNVVKQIQFLLQQPGMQDALSFPRDTMIIYDYLDEFRYMGWSQFYSGETSIQIKIVEPSNLLSMVIKAGLWLGSDDHETVSLCAQEVYQQLQSLTTLQHPVTKRTLKVLRRTVADGKARRSSTGSSTACSAYPIPEAPEHSNQLGDMSLVFEKPVWTISLHHFNDGIMETAHKSTKSGSLRCSGGRAGPFSDIQYQEAVLSQQMLNNLMQINNRENNPITSSATKLKRKLIQQENGQESVVKHF